ncbi:hypothetical protein O181_027960 [Austropuccinia psidii MF-1]|uniref:Uncharacterized protein n=1 Tax=Austropuccinia psidii MF-1 TaxID=1389203 RepID=A0A9Q3H3Q1_9BASI|nr:hypothetical protein [Austropuccinia psidii MF-1]
MPPVHLRDLGIPRNKPEDRKRLLITRRPGFGQGGEWKDTQRDHAHTPIHLPVQHTHKTRGLDRHGSSPSAPPTSQRPFSI